MPSPVYKMLLSSTLPPSNQHTNQQNLSLYKYFKKKKNAGGEEEDQGEEGLSSSEGGIGRRRRRLPKVCDSHILSPSPLVQEAAGESTRSVWISHHRASQAPMLSRRLPACPVAHRARVSTSPPLELLPLSRLLNEWFCPLSSSKDSL